MYGPENWSFAGSANLLNERPVLTIEFGPVNRGNVGEVTTKRTANDFP